MRQVLARRLSLAFAGVALVVLSGSASAQGANWPNRPLRIIVPLTTGGSNDQMARILAEKLPAVLGQPVVVENRPGAGGNVGTDYVARQPADGYTLLLSSNTHVINLSFFAKLPYDPIKDFEPVSLVATVPFVMTVNSSLPVRNVKEFIAYARTNRGQVTYGTAGIGTPHHLSAELLKSMTGIEMTHVPYKGAAQIVPALLANEITVTIGAINTLLPHIRSGRLRALAVSADHTFSVLPDVPTMADAGGLPGFSIDVWLGVLAPAGTPRPIVDRLNAEIRRIVFDPQVVRERLSVMGVEPAGSTPEQYLEVMKADIPRYARIARDARIQAE
jgi:tripartite-type tricarboxylate transporter receptor subunit TctC